MFAQKKQSLMPDDVFRNPAVGKLLVNICKKRLLLVNTCKKRLLPAVNRALFLLIASGVTAKRCTLASKRRARVVMYSIVRDGGPLQMLRAVHVGFNPLCNCPRIIPLNHARNHAVPVIPALRAVSAAAAIRRRGPPAWCARGCLLAQRFGKGVPGARKNRVLRAQRNRGAHVVAAVADIQHCGRRRCAHGGARRQQPLQNLTLAKIDVACGTAMRMVVLHAQLPCGVPPAGVGVHAATEQPRKSMLVQDPLDEYAVGVRYDHALVVCTTGAQPCEQRWHAWRERHGAHHRLHLSTRHAARCRVTKHVIHERGPAALHIAQADLLGQLSPRQAPAHAAPTCIRRR
eukprot:365714-Chlamydomonas_euryale.AAC.9